MPESRYNPDNEDLARKTSQMKEVLISARDVLLQFVVSLPAPEQVLLAQAAILPFLKDLNDIKAHFTGEVIGNAGEEEDNANTVINGDDNRANGEVPEDGENNSLNPEAHEYLLFA